MSSLVRSLATTRWGQPLLRLAGKGDWAAPILIGATGGSGTRALRQMLMATGVFMGNRVNESGDAMDFEPLLDDVINPVLSATHGLDYDPASLPADLTEQATAGYRTIAEAFLADRPDESIAWGWKNPRSMYLLPMIHAVFPGLRFIHLIRDGRDMALSDNQNQTRKHFAALMGQEPPADERIASIMIWAKANGTAADWAARVLQDRVFTLRFEDLCAQPAKEARRLFDWAGLSGNVDDAAQLIKPPSSIGRSRELDAATAARMIEIAGPQLERFGYG